MEVTVSPDPDDPHRGGSVALVKDGYVIFAQITQVSNNGSQVP